MAAAIRRLGSVALVLSLAVSLGGCSSWKVRKSYTLRTDIQTNVGDTMVFSERIVVKNRTGEKVPGRGERQELLDVKYDLSSSDIVVFRQFRLRVLEANNEHIRFQVLQDAIDATPGEATPN